MTEVDFDYKNDLKNKINIEEKLMKKVDNRDLSTPEDFTEPAVLYETLKKTITRYHPSDDISLVEKAYNLAYNAHKDQVRKSGEPYIIHPLCVAIILAELELDKETIIAGLLHDVVEDTNVTSDEICEEFSAEIALLVDGVTKIGNLQYCKDKVELEAENLRRMFLAMAKDIRVILIKLADRLHNMRTMQYMIPKKQIQKSRETLEIYAPIADRLGISKVKDELDDLALKYLEPEIYNDLVKKINQKKIGKEKFINNVIEEIKHELEVYNIDDVSVDGRIKHTFSIYKKMKNQNKSLEQIYDLFAIRIKVRNKNDCFTVLGIIHALYKPVPNRFKDYINGAKANGYQSLHTTVISSNGQTFEVQIRTYEMHRIAEYGIAAHWKYKEGGSSAMIQQQEIEKLSWLRQILEMQRESDDKEFMENVKGTLDIFAEQVYCFTPKGETKVLPKGSTPIDFAYNIHSAVGNTMVGARVNGCQVTFDYELQHGDVVEIITSQNSKGPSRDWLNIVRSTQAKNKINQWFKAEFKEENIVRGKELINAYCKAKSLNLNLYNKYQNKVMLKYGFKDWDSVLASVGHGGLKEGQVIGKLIEEYDKENSKKITGEDIINIINKSNHTNKNDKQKHKGIVIKGLNDVSVRFSRCCNPVPGDEIIGFTTRGRGISVHRTDCQNIIYISEIDKERLIDAEWEVLESENGGEVFATDISIYTEENCSSTDILLEISKLFKEDLKIDVKKLNINVNKQNRMTISASFDVKGTEQLNIVISKLRNIKGIIDIERI